MNYVYSILSILSYLLETKFAIGWVLTSCHVMGLGVKSFQCQVKSFDAQPLVMYVSVIFNSYCIILIDYLFLGIFLVHLSFFKGEYCTDSL